MNTTQASTSTRLKVGLFTFLGLALTGAITVYVNDKPYWWRSCQLVHIKVDDATGLKSKSPVRSLGLEIGYLESVQLSETSVDLGICITAPVEVLPVTKAYIKADGFLGDKFVELKPVKYVGSKSETKVENHSFWRRIFAALWIPEARAEEEGVPVVPAPSPAPAAEGPPPTPTVHRNRQGNKEIPVGENQQDVQHIMERVDE
ncbi:MAG: MlaD family protein, partial [Bdellovibrionota bacterium]